MASEDTIAPPSRVSSGRRALRWLKLHPYTCLGALVLAGAAPSFLRLKKGSDWVAVYIAAGRLLKEGKDFYEAKIGYLYPPFMAWAAMPFASWTPLAARAFWYAVSAVSFVCFMIWAWRASGGRKLEPPGSAARSEHLIYALGLALGIRYAFGGFSHHQTDLPVSALVVGGTLALLRSRALLGAACFGLAAAIKCTPLLFSLYLVWRRRWLAAACVAFIAVGLNLLPNLAGAPPEGGIWLGEWAWQYLFPMTKTEHYPGVWGSHYLLNQSYSGALYRWFATSWAWDENGFQVFERSERYSASVLKVITYGTEVLLLLASFIVMGRARPTEASPRAGEPPRIALECSVVLLLMVLLSPMSSKPHFTTMVFAGFALARHAVARKSMLLGAILLAAIVAGTVSIKDIWGWHLASLALWYGAVTISAFLTLAGCLLALLQLNRERDTSPLPG